MMILVTGAAGFIGFNLIAKLLKNGFSVIGIDNLNDYYDLNLKQARLENLKHIKLEAEQKFIFFKVDIQDNENIKSIFDEYSPSHVIHLAAQAGVRYSISNPDSYIGSNLVGFFNIIENCKNNNVKHFLYASSSSVYGGNTKIPFCEEDSVDHPVSLYGATKKCNELIAHTYSHIYKLPTTGLRFFTVYGPWGRPDMALFLFTKSIIEGNPIEVFNNGEMMRDFTYIDDVIESLFNLIHKPATPKENFNPIEPDPSSSCDPYRVFNIGNSKPVPLMKFINEIEECLGIKAKKIYLPMQKGDVQNTSSDTLKLKEWINFKPDTSVKEGINEFIKWYKIFYKI